MKNKKTIVRIITVVCVVVFVSLFGNKIARLIPLVTVQYSKTEMLSYLKRNYKEKFKIKEEIPLDKNEKDRVYIAYPVNDETVEFYVLDRYDNGYIGFGGSKGPSRELFDTYTNALLAKDLHNIEAIYPYISGENYKPDYEYFLSNLWMGSHYQEIDLSYNLYRYVEEVANKYVEICKYIGDNIAKYKNVHTKIQIKTKGFSFEIGNGVPSVEKVKYNLVGWLIKNHRENRNRDIFSIPADVKEKYSVEDIGNGNYITTVIINGEIIDTGRYRRINMDYIDGGLRIDIGQILRLMPGLESSLLKIDYTGFQNLNKIPSEEDIIFAYEVEDGVFIITKNYSYGAAYIYRYENHDISQIDWSFYAAEGTAVNDNFSEKLKRCFEISVSYDFEKEILYLEY